MTPEQITVLAFGIPAVLAGAWWLGRAEKTGTVTERVDKAAERAAGDHIDTCPDPGVWIRCVIHGDYRAKAAACIVDTDARPRIAWVPCGPCGEARELRISPAISAWLQHHGALTTAQVDAAADGINDYGDFLRAVGS